MRVSLAVVRFLLNFRPAPSNVTCSGVLLDPNNKTVLLLFFPHDGSSTHPCPFPFHTTDRTVDGPEK